MNTNVPATQREKGVSIFANDPFEDLGEGIRSALAQLSINQNVFSINFRGLNEPLPNEKLRQVEVVIVKSARTQSKAYWASGFTGGGNPPDCWSSNSLVPDQDVPNKVSPQCNTCPMNAFHTNQQGLKSKPCGDHKRLAIVPADDLENETYGGPMVFRVPAGSLGALDKYGKTLKHDPIRPVQYYATSTWITIYTDQTKKVTKLAFDKGRDLTNEEEVVIKALRDDEKSGRIVNETLIGYVDEEGEVSPNVAPVAAPAPQAAPPVPPRPPQPAATRSQPPQAAAPMPPRLQAAQTAQTPPAPPRPPTAAPISNAVSRPAAPPPSQRPVVKAPPLTPEPQPVAQAVEHEHYAPQEDEGIGEVPEDIDAVFADLGLNK